MYMIDEIPTTISAIPTILRALVMLVKFPYSDALREELTVIAEADVVKMELITTYEITIKTDPTIIAMIPPTRSWVNAFLLRYLDKNMKRITSLVLPFAAIYIKGFGYLVTVVQSDEANLYTISHTHILS